MPTMNRVTASYATSNPPTAEMTFDRLGHPGKFTSVITHRSGQLDLTGVNYGYGGIVVVDSGTSDPAGTGGITASLSGGGNVALGTLTTNTMYNFSLSSISGSGEVQLYKVQ
tara:strand:+ start:42 stop:377 length:336 start_codon:yes stop_codon:yes gene_type:complete